MLGVRVDNYRSRQTGLKQTGFSLIELMVTMIIGLLILAAVTAIFLAMLNSNNDNLKSIRLNQDLRAAMSLITRNIRRSGVNLNSAAFASTAPVTANPFVGIDICQGSTLQTPHVTTGDRLGNGIIIYYDEDPLPSVDAGILNADEWFAYRFDSANKEIEIGNGDPGTGVPCTMNAWEAATDNTQVSINSLSFLATQSPPVPLGGITPVRQVTVTISGELMSDSTVSRTLTETVTIRN